MADSFLPPSMRPDRSYADILALLHAEGKLQDYEDTLLRDASKGIHAAQAELVTYTLHLGDTEARQAEALVGAEVFARMAAMHGDLKSQQLLAGVLIKRAVAISDTDERRSCDFAAEAFRLLEALWQAGRSDVLLEAAERLNVGAAENDLDAVLFDAAIAAVKPVTAQAINNHVKSRGH